MITNKIKTRHWFLLILLVIILILALIVIAFIIGNQYYVVTEEFQLIFYLSMALSAVLLIVGIMYLEKYRRKE